MEIVQEIGGTNFRAGYLASTDNNLFPAGAQLTGGQLVDQVYVVPERENLIQSAAGASRDLLVGDGSRAQTFRPGDGGDFVYAGAGNDTVMGGAGSDFLDGGEGNDVADYSDFSGPITLRKLGPDGTPTGIAANGIDVWSASLTRGTVAEEDRLRDFETISFAPDDEHVFVEGTLSPKTGDRTLLLDGGGRTIDFSGLDQRVEMSFDQVTNSYHVGGSDLSFVNFAEVIGSDESDELAMTAGSDIEALFGGAGFDTLDIEGAGSSADLDIVRGADGTVSGTLVFDTDPTHSVLITGVEAYDLAGGDNTVKVAGANGASSVFVSLGDGGSTIEIDVGNVVVAGGQGADHFKIDVRASGKGPIVIWGGAGADTIEFTNTDDEAWAGLAVMNVDSADVSEETLRALETGKLDDGVLAQWGYSNSTPDVIIINPEASDKLILYGRELGSTHFGLVNAPGPYQWDERGFRSEDMRFSPYSSSSGNYIYAETVDIQGMPTDEAWAAIQGYKDGEYGFQLIGNGQKFLNYWFNDDGTRGEPMSEFGGLVIADPNAFFSASRPDLTLADLARDSLLA